MADEILTAACKLLGCKVADVLSHRVYEDHIRIVVNKGIQGCPQYDVSLADLQVPEPKPEPKKKTARIRKAVTKK